ncbi:MAG: hypothetical protein H7308_17110 [Chthonomonadaceae bacterium]|nr:hypothetical protein [Chthonomonadaceae bacterium]
MNRFNFGGHGKAKLLISLLLCLALTGCKGSDTSADNPDKSAPSGVKGEGKSSSGTVPYGTKANQPGK